MKNNNKDNYLSSFVYVCTNIIISNFEGVNTCEMINN